MSNPEQLKKNKVKLYPNRSYDKSELNYVKFDSLDQVQQWAKDSYTHLKPTNYERISNYNKSVAYRLDQKSWFGERHPQTVKELREHNQYRYFDKFNEVKTKIERDIQKLRFKDAEEKIDTPKIQYSAREFGIFSFDRAAIGLHRVKNAKINHLDQVSEMMRVEMGQLRPSRAIHTPLKTRTSVRKVYAVKEIKPQSEKAIKIFIFPSFHGRRNGDEFYYQGILGVLISEMLVKREYNVEVNCVHGASSRNNYNAALIKLKEFGGKLDKNRIMVLTSDPMYYRYHKWQLGVALFNYFGLTYPEGFGYPFSVSESLAIAKAIKENEKIDSEILVLAPVYSEKGVLKQLNEILKKYK